MYCRLLCAMLHIWEECGVNWKELLSLWPSLLGTEKTRQLTFEQDSDWHPRVLPSGKIMYLRWEYTDTPHYYSRYLFQMNPDGTGQTELWGSGSYFPTAYVWARPIPGAGSKIIGVVSGHHAKSETGRLLMHRNLGRVCHPYFGST